ncbi:alpha/beta fold hydrolase [Pseudonocardia dioxanivorans]|uniref:Alpha/beta hydrolase fold protein n=1 Tax=Pseudonocardia dioxanivorans (strain ATCC 55486 / DSM 44775 / JCM 13855 / CB1190) TaxID=675635 RepID=F4CRM9_PSEUX|nr:alpha/beta hydrolase [Pseudonocardia dioxanivorans]AEA26237.1 alpha/beta hydrolase fold protein [Pseudonocardia dioxanivorans CB1190]
MPILDVDGLPTYFESTGDGPALVLLHGGIVASDSWGPWPELLAAGGYTVLTPDRRGHGGTPDVPGPITYGAMADDTIAFLRAAVGGPAHLVGWSDGAVVAALVSMRAPELVARQVLIGQYYSPDGIARPEFLATLEAMRADPPDFLRSTHPSPDGPDHFPVVVGKLLDMFAREPDIDLRRFAGVTAPTLVLQGDRDEVTVAHGKAVADTLPAGRFAILPGTHSLPLEAPELVAALVLGFLAGTLDHGLWETGPQE